MIDYLLSTEENEQCKSEMTNMLLCKDSYNNSVLSEYFSRDSGSLTFSDDCKNIINDFFY